MLNVSTKVRFALQVAATCSILAACATAPAEPKVKIVESHVAVATSCIPKDKDPGQPKPYADANLPTAQEAIAERFQFIAAANEQRKARLAVLEPILSACR